MLGIYYRVYNICRNKTETCHGFGGKEEYTTVKFFYIICEVIKYSLNVDYCDNVKS